MRFDTPATINPIDQLKVVGKPIERIDGQLKTTGRAHYAYEWHDPNVAYAYGYVIGSAIAKGRIASMDITEAKRAPGVFTILTADSMEPVKKGSANTASLFGGKEIQHYHQAIGLVVAETFEQARAASYLVKVQYEAEKGAFDLAAAMQDAVKPGRGAPDSAAGDFDHAFAIAAITLDETYTTPDQSHSMMEPHASIAAWNGDEVTVWTSSQMINPWRRDLAIALGVDKEKVHLMSPFIGGGFGSKLFLRADAVLAALGAKAAGRPVKVALTRPFLMNNTTHRPATIQRIRIGADRDGKITAIGHESWSGNLKGGGPENAVQQTRLLYAGAGRMTRTRLAALDLPEGNAMRAPGEAPGLMALEIAMDEMADRLGLDPVEFRIINDTQVDPENPDRPFSHRNLVGCLRTGAEHFGWETRNSRPGSHRDGQWLVGMGVASAFRNNMVVASGARVMLDRDGVITVETDMTDIGTGSYTIIAQTAAEMLGVPMDKVAVQLGDLALPRFCRVRRATGCQQLHRWRLCRMRQAARGDRAEARLQFCRCHLRRWRGPVRQPAYAALAGSRTGRDHCRGYDRIWRLPEYAPAIHLRRPFCRGGRRRRDRRDPDPADAGRLRRRPHPQSADCTQPGDRRDDHGRGRRAFRGACGGQDARLLCQSRPCGIRSGRARRYSASGGDFP